MKTKALFPEKVFLIATVCLFFALIKVSAQGSPENNVIAVRKDGVKHVVQTTLFVAVFPLDASPMKFQVALENKEQGYTKIKLKDGRGNIIHRPVIIMDKKRVVNFNTSELKEGNYVVEVSNNKETHRYNIEVGSKVMRSVEVRPGVLAKVKLKD